ncbi:MAG: CoA transferase [Acidimicrobiia bacterium]|nr:CoA transferase [Acidimicrobiia bacterium]
MSAATGTEVPRILEGVKVLDFTQYLAGPTVTRLMAELGADIVKVEQAPYGDPARKLPYFADGRSAYFVQQNRGKRSVCVDFDRPEAIEVLRDLVRATDVVVENYGPGVLEKRGLDYASLAQINPRLVMASISAFGRRNSPLAHKVGFDTIAQAFSGFMHMTGDREGPPYFVGVGFADVSAGVHALTGLALALFHRERTGSGQWVDISMIDCLFHAHELNVQLPAANPRVNPKRAGLHGGVGFPAGTFQGPQGYIVIIALDRQWPNFAQAVGHPEWVDDERYATGRERARNRAELVEMTEAWMATFATDQEVLDVLEAHRVPCAPVLSPREALEHPYYLEREMVRTVPDPILGEVKIPGFPFKFSQRPDLPELATPALGEHNAATLAAWAGYDQARIDALAADGVLSYRALD